MTNTVQNDQLRVTVEMGDGYEPSNEVSAALSQLGAALSGDSQAEVEGFMGSPQVQRSFSFDSLSIGKAGSTNNYTDKASTGSWKVEEGENSWKMGK